MKIDLEKLKKEQKLQSIEIVEGKKYLLVFDNNAISRRDLERLPVKEAVCLLVDGNPDEVFSMYEIK